MEEKKRRGYKTKEQQTAANKRWEERNPEAKEKNKISRLKSTAKRFVKQYASDIELDELQVFIKEKKGEIKMLKNLKKEFAGAYDEIALAIAHRINFYLRNNNIKFKNLEIEEDFIRLSIDESNIYIFDLEKKEKAEIKYYEVVNIYKNNK